MAFDVYGAIKAGYSPAEVADYLGKQSGFDAQGAMKAGYTPDEVIGHLNVSSAGAGRGVRMANVFDQFDAPSKNIFDQFDPVSPSAGAGKTSSAPKAGIIASAQANAAPDSGVYGADDAWGSINQAADTPNRSSVLQGVQMDAPAGMTNDVDVDANRSARNRSASPNSVMFKKANAADAANAAISAGRQNLDAQAAQQAATDAARPDASVSSVAGGMQNLLALSAMKTAQSMRLEYADATGDSDSANSAKKMLAQIAQWQQEATPKFKSTTGQDVFEGASGLVNSIPALAVGSLDPLAAVGVFMNQGRADTYGDARMAGADQSTSALAGMGGGAIMGATEFLPMNYLFNKLGKEGFANFVKGMLMRDVPMMEAQSIASSAVATAADPGKTWGDFVDQLPDTVRKAAISGFVFSLGIGGANMAHGAAARATDAAIGAVNPGYQAAREMSRTMDSTDLSPANLNTGVVQNQYISDKNKNDRTGFDNTPIQVEQGVALNPNIINAPDVDSAIAAASLPPVDTNAISQQHADNMSEAVGVADQMRRIFSTDMHEPFLRQDGIADRQGPDTTAQEAAPMVEASQVQDGVPGYSIDTRADGALIVKPLPELRSEVIKSFADAGIPVGPGTGGGFIVGRSGAARAREVLSRLDPRVQPPETDAQPQVQSEDTKPDVQTPAEPSSQATGASTVAKQDDATPMVTSPRFGRDGTALHEGGAPFTSKAEAQGSRKNQPQMRVVKVDGGFALAEKTPAQLAAEQNAAKRLSRPMTSPAGQPTPAHAFIAANGGLGIAAKREMGLGDNPRVGNRKLFSPLGKSIEQATQALTEDRYLPPNATHSDAYALIKRSLTEPQYSHDGWERVGEAGAQARYEDHLAAAQEDFDPMAMVMREDDPDALHQAGYANAPEHVQAEVQALLSHADLRDVPASIHETANENLVNPKESNENQTDPGSVRAGVQDRASGDAAEGPEPRETQPQGRGDRLQDSGNQGDEAGQEGLSPNEAAAQHIDAAPDLNTLQKAQAKAALRNGDIQAEDVLPKRLEDFGEKIAGARKDYSQRLEDAKALDLATEPLSKTWPEPEYSKLLDSGTSPWSVAFVHASRDMIPAKPKQPWKLKQYVAQVTLMRNIASRLLSGDIDESRVSAKLSESEFDRLKQALSGPIDLYIRLGHAKSLKGIEVTSGAYSLYDGVQHSPPKTVWTVGPKGSPFSRDNATGNTRAEAVDAFVAKFKAQSEAPAPQRSTKFDAWSKGGKFFIGKKMGASYLTLKEFADRKSMLEYRATHQAELEGLLAKAKSVPNERSDENLPRIGEDHRNGADVTPEVFQDAYGFRGVQFGNYVEGTRRQQDLNNAYDALHDLAAIAGLPTKAMSLNGQLGIAFGARGRGGKNAAAAHYEPDQTVINLTKNAGAGSLAHEFFHALDNYFSRLDGGPSGFITEGSSNPAMRPEMAQAFKNLITTIKATGMGTRSRELDKLRSKPYWATNSEMSARAFEGYAIQRLHEQGASNDYLANVVGEDYWKAQNALLGNQGKDTYPYPTEREMQPIGEAFDKFFDTLQNRPGENGNVVLFSKSGATPEENALHELSKTDDLFNIKPSHATTVEDIARDIDPSIEVKKLTNIPGETRYNITMPSGTTARMMVRPYNEYVGSDGTLCGFHLDQNHEMAGHVMGRPGENSEHVEGKDDVYIDVSLLRSGEEGNKAYAIAEAYAHNTDKVFIGDPAGLSDTAMVRRPEQMLASALKRGTTDHLAPHPRQIAGDSSIGVKPLSWTYGDHIANIRSLIDVSNGNYSHLNPVTFDPVAGRFSNTEGAPLDEHALRLIAESGPGRESGLGLKTLQRNAILESLVREGDSQGEDGGSGRGLLHQLLLWTRQFGGSTREIFNSRADSGEPQGRDRLSGERGVRDAIAQELPAHSNALDRMLQRGANGDRGGLVVIDSAEPAKIAQAYQDKTGRQFDPAIEDIRRSSEGDIQGFYDPASGMTFMVAPNLDAKSAPAVLLHEMMHSQQRQDIDRAARDLMDNASGINLPVKTRQFLQRVNQRLAKAGELANTKEPAAYIVEQAVSEGRQAGFSSADGKFMDWVDKTLGTRIGNMLRDLVSMVRAHGLRLGVNIKPSIDDLVAYAKLGMKSAAKGETVNGDGVLQSDNHESDVSPSGFYSALSRGVDAINASAAPVAGWKDAVKGLVKKGLVKADEVEWTGLNDWLNLQQGKVSKTQVQDYLKNNGVQVHEVMLTGDETSWDEHRTPGGTNYRELLLTLPQVADAGVPYRHHDEPNVLGHLRMSDFTDADGKRVLLVDEVQSDWSQLGRKQGFDQLSPRREVVKYGRTWAANDDTLQRTDTFKTKTEAKKFADEMEAKPERTLVSAPFVTKTDAWASLLVKRAIKTAVDEGYDRIAFQNGDNIAKRFSLDGEKGNGMRGFYDEILPKVVKDVSRKLGGDSLTHVDLPRTSHIKGVVIEKEVPGKFTGYGVKDTETGKFWNEDSDKGAWSDSPSLFRGMGASFDAQRRAVAASEPLRLRGLDITPAMREGVANGMPLFSKYGGPGKDMLDSARSFISKAVDDLADSGIGETAKAVGREAAMAVVPMNAGSARAQAAAQRFANQERASRYKWQQVADLIEKSFTPAQRKAMWEAADVQNDMLRADSAKGAGQGLDSLPADQRAVVQELHNFSNQLWQRAKDAGLVKGDAVPYWTPRLMVMMGEDGSFQRVGDHGMNFPKAEGSNVSDKAKNLLKREYDTADETEQAAKAMYGESTHIVRDILTMPIAMARVEKAIASRELINQIQDIGRLTGKELVGTDSDATKFFTLDHPAFRTYGPKTDLDGNLVRDFDGRPVMEQKPIYVSKEFEGPLKAVLSKTDGTIYSGLMLLKSKAMSAIMVSPLMHNMVIYGRSVGYSPLKVGTGLMYFQGHRFLKDSGLVRQAILDGMVPIGNNRGTMIDVTDIAGNVKQLGRWGDPNESWISLAAQKVGNLAHDGLGDMAKQGLDAMGDFIHHTLLWKQVGALQLGIYKNEYDYRTSNGMSPEAAGAIAAHQANRFAGAMANENMSEYARKIANMVLFSRSFTLGNLGALKDTLTGLPSGMKSKLLEEIGSEEGKRALRLARTQAGANFLKDTAFLMVITAAVQSAVDKWIRGKSDDDIAQGYKRRLNDWGGEVRRNPLNLLHLDHLSPTNDNEPGRQNRINLGAQESGRNLYVRLPFGKVIEDWIGWMTEPDKVLRNKLSPMLKGLWEASRNEDVFGHPVRDPDAEPYMKLAQWLEVVAKAQFPADQAKSVYHVAKGDAPDITRHKLAGELAGFSVGQGYPGGPQSGVMADANRGFQAKKQFATRQALDELLYGNEGEAVKIMEDAGMTPKEVNTVIRGAQIQRTGPSRSSKKQFNRHSTPGQQQALDNVSD